MHLLLMLPSSILLILLFLHSWRYRGRRVTLAFFLICFIFGIIRGNTIHYIITSYFKGDSLPYLFVQPMVRIANASLQECIGWIFALYLSWSTVEWVLARQSGGEKIGLFRLIGLSGILMGCVAYAVEAAAAGVKWWVWVFPIKNEFFADVPFAGIIAWISVAVDFLLPFLLIRHGIVRSKWIIPIFLLFPFHMLTHLKVTNISGWIPLSPNEIWHWAMICALFWGIVVGGPEITPWTAKAEQAEQGKKSWLRYTVFITVAGFILVLAMVHLAIIGQPELAVSMVPFVTGVLFFNPLYAVLFLIASCLLLGFATGAWSYMLAPLLVFLIFTSGSRHASNLISLLWRRRIAVAVLAVSTVAVYLAYADRLKRYETLTELEKEIHKAETVPDLDNLIGRLPSPGKPWDAYHYNLMATQFLKRNNFISAKRLLEKAIALDSTYAYPYTNIAWAYRGLHDYDAAIAAYEKGLWLNPVDMDSYLLLGEIYTGLDSLKKAEALYRRALKYRKDDVRILLALESTLYRMNRLDEAISLLKSKLAGSADPVKLASRLAVDLWKKGRSEEAETYYLQVIHEDAERIYGAATSLALIYWQERKNPKRALEFVNLAAAVKPTADIFTLKGTICEQLGLKDQAWEAYRKAEEIKVQDSSLK
jgi:tetratricopeptide (TPR) repeat protein